MKMGIEKKYIAFTGITGAFLAAIYPFLSTFFMDLKSPKMMFPFILSVIAYGAFATVISYFIGKKTLIQSVEAINQKLEEVAGGNLSARLFFEGDDAFSRIGKNFSDFAAKLESSMLEVQNLSQSVKDSSDNLYRQFQQLIAEQQEQSDTVSLQLLKQHIEKIVENAKAQAKDAHHTTASISELSRAMMEIQNTAEVTKNLSVKTSDKANSGTISLQKNVNLVEGVKVLAHEIEGKTQLLTDCSKEIASRSTDIYQAAAQTSVLLVRAAMEAAKVGEAGMDFSAVADEIRSMAEASQAASIEINKVIERIEAESLMVKQLVKNGYQEVHHGMEYSEELKVGLTDILDNIHRTGSEANKISSVISQQSKSIETVVDFVNRLNAQSENIGHIAQGQMRTIAKVEHKLHHVKKVSEALQDVGGKLDQIIHTLNAKS